ncbi:hypothetical protein [Synechococcus elongatus]|nr:hypothetical protein [Synechococcus elongatus]
MSWLVWIQQPLSVGVIAHPHTHATRFRVRLIGWIAIAAGKTCRW